MIGASSDWAAIWAVPHKVEWQYLIGDFPNAVAYTGRDIMGVPVLTRPLMDKPVIGRCCTATLEMTVREKPDHQIPRAATVIVQGRLVESATGNVSNWVQFGVYNVSKRDASDGTITLHCVDGMRLSGRVYSDLTQFRTWPQKMIDVVTEIAGLMGSYVSRAATIGDYSVDYPNEGMLISEVLANIAAANGGVFVSTEGRGLRLVKFPDTQATAVANIGKAYSRYEPQSNGVQTVGRLTLKDDAGNQFTKVGTPLGGYELASECIYATQAIANATGAELIGRTYQPYTLTGARIDPRIEPGDTFAITNRAGVTINLIAASIKTYLNASACSDISFETDAEDEEEIPYISPSELKSERYVSTTATYFGNKLNRSEGFVSELMVNDQPAARTVLNSNQFSMERLVDGAWEKALFFDTVNKEYRFNGRVDIQGALTVNSSTGQLNEFTSNNIVIDGLGNVTIKGDFQSGSWALTSGGLTFTEAASGLSMDLRLITEDTPYGLYRYFDFKTTGADVQYGSTSSNVTAIDGRQVWLRSQIGGDVAVFCQSSLYQPGYSDAGLFCYLSSADEPKGNIGAPQKPWSVVCAKSLIFSNTGSLSSRDYKHDIETMPDVGGTLDRLRPVLFRYNTAPDELRRGLIYEEAIDVMPDICKTDASGMKMVSYTELIPVLLREIQSLRSRVKSLEGKA